MPESSIQTELINLTSELIRIPSVHSRPTEILRCADFIADWLREHAISCQRIDQNGVPSLLVAPATSRCKVLLMSHFDVVEAEESQFTPYEEDGRLFGRGAIDDKYAVALTLILYRELRTRWNAAGKTDEELPFGLLFTGDEESGGKDGAGHATTLVQPDYFIALDGGQPDRIITKEKGILSLALTAHGKAAHAARPWLGESGFDILVEDYLQLKTLFTADNPDHWHPTLVLSNCLAGNGSTNMVPDTATATLDIRYTENDNPEQMLAMIRKSIRSDVEVRAIEPVFASENSPYTDLLARHSGASISFEHGASDARFFSQIGIPGAVWGPQGEMSQHTTREHLVIDSLFGVYECLQNFLEEIAFTP
ncbi:M20 family metallopeptidase [Desulfopila aestuarii]|uniref:Succinyl-diaminopimelate desuccinylase n=1 Tax=Desulfopila aestuarii DSM 18488 TaxID=1121416 RepID=A0A1M7Y571_9BACT|nr:M20/M25/M40 family metallo-hydrolase [Desulfopila aestuarii]SHO47579.1 succinyl-diaminopimelate desuccinylase [Desulfopila aestuarii DSM 18488]